MRENKPLTVRSVEDEEYMIDCSDHMACRDDQTCCKLVDGSYGCCPFAHAVCCSDKVHCCPANKWCDTKHGKCIDPTMVFQKSLSSYVTSESSGSGLGLICADKSECSDKSTCCMLKGGKYGCCPFERAVCCGDGLHCCPNGYACTKQGTCVASSDVYTTILPRIVPMKKKVIAVPMKKKVPAVPNSAVYAYPDTVPMLRKLPATKTKSIQKQFPAILKAITRVKCDDKSSCPLGTTCCKLSSGEYGCCPYKKAVCCIDEEHCCPNGMCVLSLSLYHHNNCYHDNYIFRIYL